MSVEKCSKTGSVGIFPARYCAKAFKHSCQHLSVSKEIKQDTKIWTHELTDTEAASGESFVSWEEILNSSVVVVRHCHSTQRLVATFAAELTLTLTHHSVTTTTTTLRLHHASSTIPAHDRRSTHISSRCIAPLQLIVIWHPIIPVSARLPSTSWKTFFSRQSFPNIVPWLYCVFVDFVIAVLF